MKTNFEPIGTVVTSAFMNSVYKTDGGHKHDGGDSDGHAGKITDAELDATAVEYLSKKIIGKVRNAGTIIGQIIPYAGMNIPRGFLLCDGGEVSRQDFPEYAAWADENAPYLTANSKVVKPDLRGLFLLGADGSDYALGEKGGEKEVVLTVEEIPSHTHTYSRRYGGGNIANGSSDAMRDLASTDTGSAGGGQPHNNMPPFFVVRYLIRAYTEVED